MLKQKTGLKVDESSMKRNKTRLVRRESESTKKLFSQLLRLGGAFVAGKVKAAASLQSCSTEIK